MIYHNGEPYWTASAAMYAAAEAIEDKIRDTITAAGGPADPSLDDMSLDHLRILLETRARVASIEALDRLDDSLPMAGRGN